MTKVIDSVEWGDPPSRGTSYDWATIADQLRSEPGRWGLVFENDRHAIKVAIMRGSIAVVDPGLGFECQTRRTHWIDNEGGTRTRMCALYMRYNSGQNGAN